jgi:hypothetical protein
VLPLPVENTRCSAAHPRPTYSTCTYPVATREVALQLPSGLVQKILQNFSDFSSHQIFKRVHKVLNIDENKN